MLMIIKHVLLRTVVYPYMFHFLALCSIFQLLSLLFLYLNCSTKGDLQLANSQVPSCLLPLLLFKAFWIFKIDLLVIFGSKPRSVAYSSSLFSGNWTPLSTVLLHFHIIYNYIGASLSHGPSDRSLIPELPLLLHTGSGSVASFFLSQNP